MAMYGTTPEGEVIKALEAIVEESEKLESESAALRAEIEGLKAAIESVICHAVAAPYNGMAAYYIRPNILSECEAALRESSK